MKEVFRNVTKWILLTIAASIVTVYVQGFVRQAVYVPDAKAEAPCVAPAESE